MNFAQRVLRKGLNIIWVLHAGIYTALLKWCNREPLPQADNAAALKGKIIYLTFDDGPGQYTKKLLSILAHYNIKATFFVTGNGDKELIRAIAQAGHAVGNHTLSHKYKEIYSSEEAFYNDLNAMDAVISEEAGIHTRLMRFPGGSSNTVSRFNPGIMTRLTASVLEKGYHYFDWNVDSDDAGKTRISYLIFRNIIKGVKETDKAIVLQHDVKVNSVAVVRRVIIWGLKNGYTFLPLSENSISCRHKVNN